MKTWCTRYDSTGLLSESVPGSSYFEPPAERIVVCDEPGCKEGVIEFTCDAVWIAGACCEDAVATYHGHDFCAACLVIAKGADDGMDPPDARDDVEYEPARRAS